MMPLLTFTPNLGNDGRTARITNSTDTGGASLASALAGLLRLLGMESRSPVDHDVDQRPCARFGLVVDQEALAVLGDVVISQARVQPEQELRSACEVGAQRVQRH